MKRFLLIIALLALSASNLPAKPASVKHTVVKPAATAQQWKTLKTRGIKAIHLTPSGRKELKIHMGSIRAALEKADINETVSVLLYVGGKRTAHLGRYEPGRKSGQADFSQIPTIKKVPWKFTRGGAAELVFLNAGGAVVARVPTKIVESSAVSRENTAIPR